MSVGDATSQVINLYQQSEALVNLCYLDRKYDAQLNTVLKELVEAVHRFEDPSAMLTLIRNLTRLTASAK